MVLEIKNMTNENINIDEINVFLKKYIEDVKKEITQNYPNLDNIKIDSLTCYIRLKNNDQILNDKCKAIYYANSRINTNIEEDDEFCILDLYVYYLNNYTDRKKSVSDFCLLYDFKYQNTLKFINLNKNNIEEINQLYINDLEFQSILKDGMEKYLKGKEKYDECE